MTDITELALSLKAAITEATPGGWYVDYDFDVCTEGCGFIAETHGNNLVHNAQYIALANPANILALVEALEKARRANGHLREQSAEWERKAISNFEDCAEMSARIEELESQRKLAFTASNRWAGKFREAEQRIAELDSRPVTVKLPPKIERDDADGWFMYNGGRVGGGAAEWYNKALDDVSSALGVDIREAE